MPIAINYWAVFVCGIAAMILGSLWYGPIFGKMWISLMGFTKEQMEEATKKGMAKLYFINFIGALVMAFVLAHFVNVWNAQGVSGAFQLVFWTWLGFIATTMLGSVLWERKPWKLYLLNIMYQLVTLFVMAFILVSWKSL